MFSLNIVEWMFLLIKFCCGTPPSCLKVRGGGGLQHFSLSPRPLGFGFGAKCLGPGFDNSRLCPWWEGENWPHVYLHKSLYLFNARHKCSLFLILHALRSILSNSCSEPVIERRARVRHLCMIFGTPALQSVKSKLRHLIRNWAAWPSYSWNAN